jgi:sugar-specific transcriptional regulator TrmB
MSLEKIVEEAMAGRPLEMKEAFAEEIQKRIQEALEARFVEMMEAKSKDDEDEDDEDEDEDDEDEDEDEMDESAGGMASDMKKLHASACSKTEMYAKMKEKYGCDKAKFEGLYASNCSD